MVIQRTPEKRENLVRLQEQPPNREVGESGRPYLLWKQMRTGADGEVLQSQDFASAQVDL